MKHFKPDRCGYSAYTCIGLPSFISDSITFCCDTTAYDKYNLKRPNDFNFYNLPTQFQSVVTRAPFIDLSGISGEAAQCIYSYDAFGQGLQNKWESVGNNEHFIEVYSDLNDKLACYVQEVTQKPGVMSPYTELSAFNIPAAVAIPAANLGVTNAQASPVDLSDYIQASACTNGFAIVPYDQNTVGYKVYVSGGDAIPGVSQESRQAQVFYVQGEFLQKQKRFQGDLQVYLVAKYDFVQMQWVFKFVAVQQGQQESGNEGLGYKILHEEWQKVVLLGTVHKIDKKPEVCITHVIQTICSPVDMRDFVSQIPLPVTTTDGTVFVLGFIGSSKIKKWIEVRDC